jgi:glucose/arabinose dehydrogenase
MASSVKVCVEATSPKDARSARRMPRKSSSALVAAAFAAALVGVFSPGSAQELSKASAEPLVFDTYVPGPCSPNGQLQGQCPPGDLLRLALVPVAEGLTNPRHLAFLPDGGGLLVAELTGRVRTVRNGEPAAAAAAAAVGGWPAAGLDVVSLHSVLVHPEFAQNRFVYLYYVKTRTDGMTTMALARGRLQDGALGDVEELFVADGWIMGGPIAGRAEFGPDGMIYLTLNDHDPYFSTNDTSVRMLVQDLGSDVGKVMRVRDDGGVPADNPFVGRADANGEIYTYGHRNVTGLAWHPSTGELWATEIGPMGGDELNVLRPGANYGWPDVSLGKLYNETDVSEQHWWRPGMEMPVMHWTPSISPSSVAFYTGERIPDWQGHLFIGALNGQMLQRVAFDQPAPQAERRDALFMPLGRRFRHVVQGPDGYLYVATEKRTLGAGDATGDAVSGTIYRLEPTR